MPRRSLFQEIKEQSHSAIAEDGRWLMGVPAIVADNQDPERQHRVRVIIPSIDEDLIFDEWARQMVFCLGDGYGSAFIPPKGSEVILFGQLGQKFNLFYASLYNEDMLISSELNKDIAGIHAPKDLKLIAELSNELRGKNTTVKAEQRVEILGNEIIINTDGSVTVKSDGNVKIEGGNVTVDGDSVKILGRTILNNGQPI